MDELSEWALFLTPQYIAPLTIVCSEWNGDIEQLKKLASRNSIMRLIHHDEDAKAISDHIQSITWSIQNLTVHTII